MCSLDVVQSRLAARCEEWYASSRWQLTGEPERGVEAVVNVVQEDDSPERSEKWYANVIE